MAVGGATIIIPSGVYSQTVAPGPVDDRAGDLNITQTVTISGAGAATTIIDGGGIDRVFFINPGVSRNPTAAIGVVLRTRGTRQSFEARSVTTTPLAFPPC